MRMKVDLPAPFGPRSEKFSPSSTRRLTSFTATKPSNSFRRPSVTMAVMLRSEE
jgi:hypothetical protein